MEWKESRHHRFLLEKFEKNFPQDEFILFITGSYGDVYPVLALMKSFVEHHKRPTNIILDKKYTLLASRFRLPGLKFHIVEDEKAFRWTMQIFRNLFFLEPGVIFPSLLTMHPFIGEAVVTFRLPEFLEAYRLLLELPVGAPLHWGEVSQLRKEAAERLLVDAGLRLNKTVIISLITNSGAQNPDIVNRIIRRFEESEFDVAINMAGEILGGFSVPNETKTISIPCDIPIEVMEAAGFMVVAHSGLGFISVVQPHNSKVVIIDPQFKERYQKGMFLNKPIKLQAGSDFINLPKCKEILYSELQVDELPQLIYQSLTLK
jgi:hypothetical protein